MIVPVLAWLVVLDPPVVEAGAQPDLDALLAVALELADDDGWVAPGALLLLLGELLVDD